ncbi:MAG: fumarate hydratase, partial [Synergistaceae bacterium]|nr:fumarate hydratase [Synergistaceae bacterium]
RRAYIDGYLRKSVVKDPLFRRENSGDNTPAVIHWKVCSGSDITITVSPKGMGSENMSRIYMLKPADGAEGVIRSVVEAVKIAGPNPCPPIVLGIGIGGNFETVALAAKKALLKPEGVRHNIPEYAEIEREILKRVNALGIGPGGYGGMTTALDAHIETLPTHIAGMPVAVNICCHALRHAEGTIEGRILDD